MTIEISNERELDAAHTGTSDATSRRLGCVAMAPIGPGSILWDKGRDRRSMFVGAAGGLLQLMHPGISAAVMQHSNFRDDPLDRIFRSLPQIHDTIFHADAEAKAAEVRRLHNGISGVDEHGHAYHALRDTTWAWAHDTFHDGLEKTIDHFMADEQTQQDKEQLTAECNTWLYRYGVATRQAHTDHAAFRAAFADTCENVLERTPAFEFAYELAKSRAAIKLPHVPRVITKLGRVPVGEFVRLTSFGYLPETLRETHGIEWSDKDEARKARLEAVVQDIWPLLPRQARHYPRARAAERALRKSA